VRTREIAKFSSTQLVVCSCQSESSKRSQSDMLRVAYTL